MRRQHINYKRVAAAATAIKSRGIEPSVTDICAELRINPSPELPKFLEQWYHDQPEFQRKKMTPLTENIKVSSNRKNNQLELEKSLSLLRATLESTADGIMIVNGQGQIVDWNQKFIEMWRIPSHLMETGVESLNFDYIVEQVKDPEKLIADVEFLYKNPEWEGELSDLHFKDGRIFHRFSQPQRIGSEMVGRVYSMRDVTQQYMAEEETRIRDRAIEASTLGVAIIDTTKIEQPIIYVNFAFERLTGFSHKMAIGKNLMTLDGVNAAEVNKKRIDLAIREGNDEVVELEFMRSSGVTFWCELTLAPVKDSSNRVTHYICFLNDITRRREMEQELIQQATHDSLTGLPNRVLLMDRVEQGIVHAKKRNCMLALLFLDLDRFKIVNDSLGHSMGDKLLCEVGNRLLVVTNEVDTVARFGGDEFVILLPEIKNIQQAELLAREVLSLLEKPFIIESHSIKITGTLGISLYPQDGDDYEALMKSADLSMYHAKDSGRNTFRVFDQEMDTRFTNYAQLNKEMHRALERKEFYLVYQPLIDLQNERIFGVEALLRWSNEALGNVTPYQFIPIAEENGLILEIGAWVLEEACSQLMRWQEQGFSELSVSVNISGRQLHNQELPVLIAKILKKTGLPAKYLELELTEGLLVENIEQAVETMHQFKDMGLKISIDDFGTGYSSLAYLKQFPVDKIKIDKSFIDEIVNNASEGAIVRAIINLGHSLNLEVLAEGIENEFQKNFILANNCDAAQGYYFKPPVLPYKFIEFLKNYLKK